MLSVRLAALLQTCPLVECWQLQCHVGLLERGSSVILTVRSRVWAETFMEVRGLYCYGPIKGNYPAPAASTRPRQI